MRDHIQITRILSTLYPDFCIRFSCVDQRILKHSILPIVLLICVNSALAAHPVNYCLEDKAETLSMTATELRNIAAKCEQRQMARLYYNRAYHKDLLKEGGSMTQLISYRGEPLQQTMETYRLYIAMIEIFAQHAFPQLEARATYLNNVYDKYDEVARLRLRGYDKTADVLEKSMLLKNN